MRAINRFGAIKKDWEFWKLTVRAQNAAKTGPGRLSIGRAGLRMQAALRHIPREQSPQACRSVVAPEADSNITVVQRQKRQTDLKPPSRVSTKLVFFPQLTPAGAPVATEAKTAAVTKNTDFISANRNWLALCYEAKTRNFPPYTRNKDAKYSQQNKPVSFAFATTKKLNNHRAERRHQIFLVRRNKEQNTKSQKSRSKQ